MGASFFRRNLRNPFVRPAGRRRSGGFTLLETLIVVAIVGIIGVLAATALRLLIPRWQLQDAGNHLDTLIKRSKLIAITRQIPIEIRFEDDTETPVALAAMVRGEIYTVVARDTSTVPREAVAKMPLHALGSGVMIDAITFGGEAIRFDVFGRAETTGQITFGYDLDNVRRQILTLSIDTLDGQTEIEEKTI